MVSNNDTGVVLTGAGMRFESVGGQEFFVNYRVCHKAQTDILTCKGTKALGTVFKWGGIPQQNYLGAASSTLGIYVTEDATYDGSQFNININVLFNDSLPDDLDLTITTSTNSADTSSLNFSSVVINPDNIITYTSIAGIMSEGTYDTFSYTICNENTGNYSNAIVVVTTPGLSLGDKSPNDVDYYNPKIFLQDSTQDLPLNGMLEIDVLKNDNAALKVDGIVSILKDNYELSMDLPQVGGDVLGAVCLETNTYGGCTKFEVVREVLNLITGVIEEFTNVWEIINDKIYFNPAVDFIADPVIVAYVVTAGIGEIGEAEVEELLLPIVDLAVDISVNITEPKVGDIIEFTVRVEKQIINLI